MSVRPLAVLLAAMALAGCQTRVTDTSTPAMAQGTETLGAPRRVLVYPLAADPAIVQLDQSPVLARQRARARVSDATQQARDAAAVQDAAAEGFVSAIRAMGLPVERASAGAPVRAGDLLIGGRISAMAEGNRLRRVGVGLGVGRSQVLAQVSVATVLDNGTRLPLKSYDADANSGRAPGVAPGMGIGAATGTLLEATVVGGAGEAAVERRRNPIAAEGDRLAKRVSYELGQYFVEQGWIAKANAPGRFR